MYMRAHKRNALLTNILYDQSCLYVLCWSVCMHGSLTGPFGSEAW